MSTFLTMPWLMTITVIAFAIFAIFAVFGVAAEGLWNDLLLGAGSAEAAGLIVAALTLDVALPIPSSLINVTAGALLGFAGGTLASWLGMTLGCLVGYWIGATGGAAAFRGWLAPGGRAAGSDRLAVGSLLAARAVPVLAETSTIAAGIAGMPLRRFVPVVALANLGLAASYASIGAFSLEADFLPLAVAAALLHPLAAMGGHSVYRRVAGRPAGAGPRRAPAGDAPSTATATATATQKVVVAFEYRVTFTTGMFDPANPALTDALSIREPDKRHRCLVFVDAGLAAALPRLSADIAAYGRAHAARMEIVEAPVIVAGGERVKTEPGHVEAILDRIHSARIDRHSYVLAVGGGAMLDAVGLAAATAHRGVRLVRAPTTVLGQNDSGVGVKNAINLKGVKNYFGTFAPPWAVLNDYGFIRALPRRERIAGVSEAVKVALIRDGAFFRWLEDNADRLAAFEPAAEQHMIRRSAELHMAQIAGGGDPFEMGSARPLDYGHWSAHKLEAMTGHEVRHGEAVAIGVALDARYSVMAGLLAPGGDLRVVALLGRLGLPIFHDALDRRRDDGRLEVIRGLEDFREHLGGALTVTLLNGLGVGREVDAIDAGAMAEAIAWLRARSRG